MLREVDEVLLQLALSETGTACRTAEQVIGQWSEGVADASWREDDNFDLIRRMFRELHEGVTVGREALARAEEIEREYGLVKSVRADRMAMATALQNPGIMTARAALLMLSLCGEMESFDLPPLGGAANWAEQREQLVRQFEEAYRAIGREVRLEDDTTTQPNLNEAHQRSIVQLRLHLGLLKPGHHLQATSQFDPFRDHPVVDGASIEALSAWLAQPADNGEGIRGDANVIGSATMHNFIRSVEACPESFGLGPSSYAQWRRRWFVLDRYAGNESRRATVEGIFGSLESPSRSRSKRVGWLSRLFGRR
jgi:hypothetical protein